MYDISQMSKSKRICFYIKTGTCINTIMRQKIDSTLTAGFWNVRYVYVSDRLKKLRGCGQPYLVNVTLVLIYVHFFLGNIYSRRTEMVIGYLGKL